MQSENQKCKRSDNRCLTGFYGVRLLGSTRFAAIAGFQGGEDHDGFGVFKVPTLSAAWIRYAVVLHWASVGPLPICPPWAENSLQFTMSRRSEM